MKSLDFEAQSTLSYALSNGILDLDRVHEMCMASKREQAKALHPYSITPPSKEGERWRTNYTDRNGKRKTIRAQTEEALLDKLIPLYLDRENLEKKTFHELFEEWIAYKAQITTSPNTILRHKQHFKKYIVSSKLYQMRILKITEILLETECNRIVREFNLSNKEWVNLKTILNGMFEFAYRMKYLQENPMPKIRISAKFRQIVKKTGRTQTYNTEELENLNTYLDEMYAQTEDVAFMAVKINFFMGLRVGELVALKWEDICEENQIHIVREEVRDQVANEITVADHTKTHTDRFVYLIVTIFILLSLGKECAHRLFNKKTPVREIFPNKRGSSVPPNINIRLSVYAFFVERHFLPLIRNCLINGYWSEVRVNSNDKRNHSAGW